MEDHSEGFRVELHELKSNTFSNSVSYCACFTLFLWPVQNSQTKVSKGDKTCCGSWLESIISSCLGDVASGRHDSWNRVPVGHIPLPIGKQNKQEVGQGNKLMKSASVTHFPQCGFIS